MTMTKFSLKNLHTRARVKISNSHSSERQHENIYSADHNTQINNVTNKIAHRHPTGLCFIFFLKLLQFFARASGSNTRRQAPSPVCVITAFKCVTEKFWVLKSFFFFFWQRCILWVFGPCHTRCFLVMHAAAERQKSQEVENLTLRQQCDFSTELRQKFAPQHSTVAS